MILFTGEPRPKPGGAVLHHQLGPGHPVPSPEMAALSPCTANPLKPSKVSSHPVFLISTRVPTCVLPSMLIIELLVLGSLKSDNEVLLIRTVLFGAQ